nr:hypothetical protein [Streptomyces sp. NWU339]
MRVPLALPQIIGDAVQYVTRVSLASEARFSRTSRRWIGGRTSALTATR